MSATVSPDTELQIRETTLQDLYNAIDWSKIPAAEGKWLRGVEKKAEDVDPSEAFKMKFRCVLLQEAFWGENKQVREDALQWLKRAGVLKEAVAFLKEHGLISD